MRILVTGGAGYIGSIVSEVLLENEFDVTVYDNLSLGHRESVPSDAFFVEGDVTDRILLGRVLGERKIDAIVHLAASSLVGESVADPEKYYRNNVAGGLSLLGAMRDNDIPYIVFSSTAAVYGEPEKQPVEEGDRIAPTNPYGETKAVFERSLHWYGRRSISLRYFNAAGASSTRGENHDHETHLVPLLLEVAKGTRESITIHGDDYPTPDGTCIRDYVHVLDIAEAHVVSLRALFSGRPSSIYNLGYGGGYSVLEIVRAVEAVTGKRISYRTGPRRAGDPAVLIASSEKIKRELGFTLKHQDLHEIIRSAWRLQ